jgi:hypothetical protein
MNILILYDQYSTFTNTIYEHLLSFKRYSDHRYYYCHGQNPRVKIDWKQFDVLVIHYCLRVAFKHIPPELLVQIRQFKRPKVLFIQDEYDLTDNSRSAILDLDINLVFTCVPAEHRAEIYPPARFPTVRFFGTLTGYAPYENMPAIRVPSISERALSIAYRGRSLSYFYGELGQEKQIIAQRMRAACLQRGIACDIEWDEQRRIYGENWIEFLISAKATLGTESGCNLFDFDGSLRKAVERVLRKNPVATYDEVKATNPTLFTEKKIMNQISPRFFEAIALKTGLVLFEGEYSGILQPWEHFIPLRKDFSNIEDVLQKVGDDNYLQQMVDRTYCDIIASGLYTYQRFVAEFDQEINQLSLKPMHHEPVSLSNSDVTEAPVRSTSVPLLPSWISIMWNLIPWSIRKHLLKPATELWRKLH